MAGQPSNDAPHALPTSAAHAAEERVPVADLEGSMPPVKSILVVDDDKAIRETVRELLVSRKYDVHIAESGDSAISICRAMRFDLILMDIQMPRMNGMETTQEIRSQCMLNRTTPIMAVTGYISVNRVAQLQNAGINDYIPKPIKFDAFFHKIDFWCR